MRTVMAMLSAFWVLGAGGLGAAGAWNDTGHEVVASIAWDHLTERTRQRVVALMAQSTDARLTGLFPQDSRALGVRQREFFVRAGNWADLIRKQEGDQPTWHYRNFYWKEENGQAVDLPDIEVNERNLLERLEFVRNAVADSSLESPERGMYVAWLVHLIGDIHQPLHCSGRVTDQEPLGDRGGNSFELDLLPEPNPERRRNNLHAYWDGMLDKAVPRRQNEDRGRYVRRVASLVAAVHPRHTTTDVLKPGKFEDWARESVAEAKKAYPANLQRDRAPSRDYLAAGARVAIERVALAGYRLAAMLEDLLGR